jgi:hypothetical protein
MAWLDLPAIISTYNVEHSANMGEQGQYVDVYYMNDLGPGVIPAIDKLLAHELIAAADESKELRLLRNNFAEAALQQSAWQSWTWRGERLRQYLSEHRYAPDGIDTNR